MSQSRVAYYKVEIKSIVLQIHRNCFRLKFSSTIYWKHSCFIWLRYDDLTSSQAVTPIQPEYQKIQKSHSPSRCKKYRIYTTVVEAYNSASFSHKIHRLLDKKFLVLVTPERFFRVARWFLPVFIKRLSLGGFWNTSLSVKFGMDVFNVNMRSAWNESRFVNVDSSKTSFTNWLLVKLILAKLKLWYSHRNYLVAKTTFASHETQTSQWVFSKFGFSIDY